MGLLSFLSYDLKHNIDLVFLGICIGLLIDIAVRLCGC